MRKMGPRSMGTPYRQRARPQAADDTHGVFPDSLHGLRAMQTRDKLTARVQIESGHSVCKQHMESHLHRLKATRTHIATSCGPKKSRRCRGTAPCSLGW